MDLPTSRAFIPPRKLRVCARKNNSIKSAPGWMVNHDEWLVNPSCAPLTPLNHKESSVLCDYARPDPLPAAECTGKWRVFQRSRSSGALGSSPAQSPYFELCFPNLLAMRAESLRGEAALAAAFPDRVLLLRHEDLFDEPPAGGSFANLSLAGRPALRKFLQRLSSEFGLAAKVSPEPPAAPWNLAALRWHNGFSPESRARSFWASWADMAVRDPLLVPIVCAQLDRAAERARGYTASMDSLDTICAAAGLA
jgi:hypothetical protein